jgi:hypothetical protein
LNISDDKQHAAIDIHGTYGVAGLEKLIGELSAMRSSMLPAVPMAPQCTNSAEDPAAARARGDPSVQVAVMRDGVTRFWVRHAGLGWFAFNLPVERARMLAEYILGITSPPNTREEFLGLKRRESDVMH